MGRYQCDDGNTKNGDGCSSTCTIEKGYICTGGTPFRRDVCKEICGDGLDLKSYMCDDGNLVNGDG
jgi:cysteine-rich repeat protein